MSGPVRGLNRSRPRRACLPRLIGCRRVLSEQAGTYNARGVNISFGGGCPVQGYGTVDGLSAYYRSRGEGWQFHLYPAGTVVDELDYKAFSAPLFYYDDYPYEWPDGGWVEAKVSKKCIAKAVALFRKHGPNSITEAT